MPLLTLNGTTIPVAEISQSFFHAGSRKRAYSGRARSSIRATKREWEITTTPLVSATATTIQALCDGVTARTAGGDLAGAISVLAELTGMAFVNTADGVRRALTISIWEV